MSICASSVEMLFRYWGSIVRVHIWIRCLAMCGGPTQLWTFAPIFGVFPLASPWIIPCGSGMNNEMLYAILLLRQAYVTVLFQCACVQNEYYTRKMNYDAMWLLMRTTVFSILMMPICYSYYILCFFIFIFRQWT